jgi:adenine phosphoribosyltransferase
MDSSGFAVGSAARIGGRPSTKIRAGSAKIRFIIQTLNDGSIPKAIPPPLTFAGEPLASPAMTADSIEKLRAAVRDVPDFPKKGIIFKDITPILGSGKLFRMAIEAFLEHCRGKKIDKIVGIDARGFLFGSAVAYDLGIGFVPLRKKGRLPYKTESAKYSLEYGEAEMELHVDAIERGERIVLIDDLLATGGTSASAATLIRKVGGDLIEAQFLIELEFLDGRQKLESTPVVSFLKY